MRRTRLTPTNQKSKVRKYTLRPSSAPIPVLVDEFNFSDPENSMYIATF